MTTARSHSFAASIGRSLTTIGTVGAVALTAHTIYNLRHLRVPSPAPEPSDELISVLIPARDEAHRIASCLTSLLDQESLPHLEILVLDDGSTDGTADVVRRVCDDDPRVRLIQGVDRPTGWLGKPWACHQLAEAASGQVLVFVDADVVVEPLGIAATVESMRAAGLDLVCPYPQQISLTPAERVVQPLLQWSWLTTLPLAVAERSPRESLVAANGQLLAIDTNAYHRAGGHASVRDEVLDDVALLRAVKRSGGTGNVIDGTDVATCRMYDGWDDLVEGYTKSLWSAFGSPAKAAGAMGFLGLVYIVPPIAAVLGSRTGAIGAFAGVTGRVVVARRTGGRVWPDSLAHPLSISALAYLTAKSWQGRRRGTLTWKGRAI